MKLNTHIGSVYIQINTKRVEGNVKSARRVLNLAVKNDCEPFVPHLNGELRDSANFPEGVYGGVLEYNTPCAHYQYTGELYLAANGSSWAKEHEKKYPAGKPLEYHEPGTASRWFEEAKRLHKKEWVEAVRKEIGKN